MGFLAHGGGRGGLHRLRGHLLRPQLQRQLPRAGHRTRRGERGQGRPAAVQPVALPLREPPAHRGLGVHRRDRAGGAVPGSVRRPARGAVGLGRGRGGAGARAGGGPPGALPQPFRHPRPPGAHLPGGGDLRGRGTPRAARDRRPAPGLNTWRAAFAAVPPPPGIVRPRGNDGSRSDPVVREVRRGGGRVEVRDLRVGSPRARPWAHARRLRPVLHAAVRRLWAGRRPLHLHLNAGHHAHPVPVLGPASRLSAGHRLRGSHSAALLGGRGRRPRGWAARMTPSRAWPIRSAACSRSGWPASSHAMTASTATVGASRAAHAAQGRLGIIAASSRRATVTMAVWNRSISARNSGSRAAWWNSSRNPSGSAAAVPTSASMLAAVTLAVPTASASRVQARSSTARYRSVLESKWRYRIARLTPAAVAMSSRPVAANPERAKAWVAAARICSRRSARRSRRTGADASAAGAGWFMDWLLVGMTPQSDWDC